MRAFPARHRPLRPPAYTWAGRPTSLGDRFVGRASELQAIGDAFTRGRAVVLSGGAGAGKSRLAAEYSHRANARGFWTTASDTVDGTLAALAPQLGVRVEESDNAEIAGEVSRTLAALGEEPLWIVDNIPDIAFCGPLLDAAGTARILATTRDTRREELRAGAEFIPVEPLEEGPSLRLLRSRGYTGGEEGTLREIAAAVGHLPLALEMLALRLAKPPRDAAAVFAALREAPAELEEFKREAGFDEQHAGGVFATIAGTLGALSAQVRQQIAPLGYIAEDPAPFPLVQALAAVDDDGLRDFLEACRRESVLTVLDDDGGVRAHALTVAAIAATNPAGAVGEASERIAVRRWAIVDLEHIPPSARRSEISAWPSRAGSANRSMRRIRRPASAEAPARMAFLSHR